MNSCGIENNRIKRCTRIRSTKGICARLEAPFALLGPPCGVDLLIIVKSIAIGVKVEGVHYAITVVIEGAINKCPIHHKEGIRIRVIYKLAIGRIDNGSTIIYAVAVRINISRISSKESTHLTGVKTMPRCCPTEQA